LTLSYDGFGRIAGLSGPDGALASYGYGTTGLLESVDYPDGTGYLYEYDERGRLLFVEDALGRTLETHTYEGDRAVTSEIAGGQEQYTLDYVSETVTQVKDAAGNTATYTFGMFGGTRKVVSRTGPCASCGGQESESWTYTPEGRVETYTDGAGRVTRYTYEADGDLASETTAYGTPEARTITYTWDAQSRPLTRTAPGEGTREWTDYVSAGPRKTRVPMDASRVRETVTVYNPTAQRPNQPAGTVASVLDADGNLTEFEYTEAAGAPVGDLRWTEDARGSRTSFTYDGMGRRSEVKDALNNSTFTEYDVQGRVKKVRQIVTLPAGPTTLETVFEYNDRGLKKSVTDPAGKTTHEYGRLQSVIDADGKSTVYTYDAMSRVKSIRNARDKTWTFEYDTHGRLWKTIWPGGRTETLTYFGDGQLHTRTDRRGVVTTFAYDAAGRLQSKTFSDGTPGVTYTYDAAGRLESASSSVDTVTRSYLLSGELQEEISTRAGTTLGYEYTLAGRRTDTTLNGQPFVEYGYTSGLLSSITRGTRTFALGFDPATRRYVLGHPNGLLTEYQYDEAGRLLSVKFGTGTPDVQNSRVNFTLVLSQTLYTYDKAGNRVTKTALDHAESYGYDKVDRLETVQRTGAGAWEWSFAYDAVGNRKGRTTFGLPAGGGVPTAAGAVQASYSDRNELTSYSAGGELRVRGSINEPGTVTVETGGTGERPARMVDDGTPGAWEFELDVPVASGTNLFTVRARDASNNLRTSNYRVDVPADSASYQYDLAGNLTTKTDATGNWTYTWNGEGQLTRVELNSTEVARFTYDPFGRRAQKVAGGVTTTWAYDGDDIVQETLTGGASPGTWRYVHGPGIDEPLARETVGAGALEYYHADGLGSIVATTNQAGAIVSTRRYDAWGNLELGATVPGYAFTGREWDPETGLYYYRARYYDPKVGRFVSEDPTGFAGGGNFYAYVGNSPVTHDDASGLWSPQAHDRILQNAFQGRLYQTDIDIMKYASREFDKATQGSGLAHMHSMAEPGEAPGVAKWKRDKWVQRMIQMARSAAMRGDRCTALSTFGQAMHAMMDSSSRMHRNANGDPAEWNPWNPVGHSPGVLGDLWVGSERDRDVTQGILDSQKAMLNQYYNEVFEY